jgi:hypothetical protein
MIGIVDTHAQGALLVRASTGNEAIAKTFEKGVINLRFFVVVEFGSPVASIPAIIFYEAGLAKWDELSTGALGVCGADTEREEK